MMTPKQFGLTIRLNAAYHAARYSFLIKALRYEKVFILGSSTFAWIEIRSHAPDSEIGLFFASIATLFAILLVVSNADEKANEHHSMYKAWTRLHKKFEEQSGDNAIESNLLNLRAEFDEIGIDQPPKANQALLFHCHNLILREIDDDERIKQSWRSRVLRNFIDLEADTIAPEMILVKRQSLGGVAKLNSEPIP